MPESRAKSITSSKKIKFLIEPNSLEVVAVSKSARKHLPQTNLALNQIKVSDIFKTRKITSELKKLNASTLKHKIEIDNILLKNSNNTNGYILKAAFIESQNKKLIECTLTKKRKKNDDNSSSFKSTDVDKILNENKKLQKIFEHSSLMIFIVDEKGFIKDINNSGANNLGYTVDELLNLSISRIFSKADRRDVTDLIKRCLKYPNESHTLELKQIKKNGHKIWSRIKLNTISLNGNGHEILFVCEDITDIKNSKSATQEVEIKLKEFVDASPLGAHIYELNNKDELIFSGYNPSADKILNIDHSQLINKEIYEAFPKLLNTDIPKIYKAIAKNGRHINYGILNYRDNNIRGTFDVSAVQIEPGKVAAFFYDISDKKKSENELRYSKQMLQLILDNVPQRIFWKDLDSNYLGCNTNFAKDAGLTNPDDILFTNDYDMPWKSSEADYYRLIDSEVIKNDKPVYHLIEPQTHLDGKIAWLETNKVPLHDEAGNVVGILGTYEDITERKKSEEALKESEQRFRSLVDNMIEATLIIDWNGFIIFANKSAARLVGLESPSHGIGKKVFDFLHPDDKLKVLEAIVNVKDST